jgi:protein dithiol oxidoreductase (disulfide-forming)
MLKRLPILLAAMALAACQSGQGDQTAAPAAAPSRPAASASTAPAAAPAAKTPAAGTSSPAPAASVADVSHDATSAESDADSTSGGFAMTPALKKAAAGFSDNGQWVEGKNYFRIDPPQPSLVPGHITVTEVFSYGCPACYHAHPYVDKMRKALPDGAVMSFLPAAFRPDENWVVYQRAYYAARALGVANESYDAMFNAVFQDEQFSSYDLASGRLKPRDQWPKIGDIAKFYTRYGVKPDEFVAVANSFSVNTKMKRADELVKAYGVGGTPTFVVDGKYRFDVRSAGGYQQAIDLAQWLVAKEAAGK